MPADRGARTSKRDATIPCYRLLLTASRLVDGRLIIESVGRGTSPRNLARNRIRRSKIRPQGDHRRRNQLPCRNHPPSLLSALVALQDCNLDRAFAREKSATRIPSHPATARQRKVRSHRARNTVVIGRSAMQRPSNTAHGASDRWHRAARPTQKKRVILQTPQGISKPNR